MSEVEERAVSAVLRELVAEPVLPHDLAGRVAVRHARHRRHVIAGTALAVAGIAVLAALVPGFARTRSIAPASHPGWYRGTGTIVAVPGLPVRFCAHTQMQPDPCAGPSIPVTGANLSHLHRESDGTRTGDYTLAGEIVDGTFVVHDQRGPHWTGNPRPTYGPITCVPPAGGWPAAAAAPIPYAAVESYIAHHGPVVIFSQYGPTAGQRPEIVVTAYDAARMATDLRVTQGGNVCIVQSAYTKAEIERAKQAVTARQGSTHPMLAEHGPYVEDAQQHFYLEVAYVSAEVRAFVARFPKGLVVPDPILRPMG